MNARFLIRLSIVFAALGAAAGARAQTDQKLSPKLERAVGRIVREVLGATGVPSASVAIVQDGRIVWTEAYGNARLEPPLPARPNMRYSIGSISKQFTATAILLLAEERKLSLDDPVSRFLPDLTRAGEVKIRDLLAHTSGYQDYWPQDYVPPFMLREISGSGILDQWARKPLDFDPGTKWQYSNTNYVIAGLIVEKASGKGLLEFLSAHVFAPLGMESVANIDQERLRDTDPVGYLRNALGPLRVAPKEGKGWLFAAGELAMTAADLARWNVGLLARSLLTPASYAEMETEVRLKNGLGTRYGLGIGVRTESGRRVLSHGGEVSGFAATNLVFPDDRAAVTVLTNEDASEAASGIAKKIVPLLWEGQESPAAGEARARQVFEAFQRGKIDRSQFTDNANSYFTELVLRDFAGSLAPLGKPAEVKQKEWQDRGGMTFRLFEVTFARKKLSVWERDMPDGKIEQYQVVAAD